jgi:putative heme-binding domain-containing protein
VFSKLQFKEPTELVFVPKTHWALVVEREARIHAFRAELNVASATPIADLREATGRDGEAYSLAFHPGFATNRFIFVSLFCRTNKPASMRISRFVLRDTDPPALDLTTERRIIDWPSDGHNGCALQFGPDRFLYISSGDGTAPAPPDILKTGQNLDDLLSVIMRIDVDCAENDPPYRVPADNPFVQTPGARPEIWAYGFRNPWKMCFDPRDGALWVGDVGWEAWELLFRIDRGGFNGGWSIVEGPQSVNSAWPPGPTPIRSPIVAHPHTEAASITGGLFYRGQRLPELRGAYLYGDWETGKIWDLLYRDGAIARRREIADTPFRIIGFAEDAAGELYFVDYTGGGIYRLSPSASLASRPDFPRKLSETGLFASTRDYQFAPGVVPYSIIAPSWADHATADFAVALPGVEKIGHHPGGFPTPVNPVPTNAVFVRTFAMEMKKGEPASGRRLETQVLHFDGYDWSGYSFRWNTNQTDADLVDKSGGEMPLVIDEPEAPGGKREQVWRFPSRTECLRCHMTRFGFLNAFIPEQLGVPLARGSTESQLDRLVRLGVLHRPKPPERPFRLVDPQDESAGLDLRARSWLHANCGHCHRETASGAVMMFLHAEVPLDKTLTVNHRPNRGDFGINAARLVAAGDPFRSALLYRTLTPGAGRMPILGSSVVDDRGTRLLRDWIASLSNTEAIGPDSSRALIFLSTLQPNPSSLNESALDELLQTTSGAMALAFAAADPARPRTSREKIITRAVGHDRPTTRDLFERFLPARQRRKLLGPTIDPVLILTRSGDVDRGRRVFFEDGGAQCHTCHRLAGEGRDFGPDLSRIGAKYDRAALLEQLLNPSKLIEPLWMGRTVQTKSGDSYSGLVTRNDRGLELKLADGSAVYLKQADLQSDEPQRVSLMPEGLLQALTAQEAADLIEFLSVLR